MKNARLLIVDDEPTLRQAFRLVLDDGKRTVSEVETAEEAMGLIEEGPGFDLLIVDKNLPGMNGVDFIRKVRATNVDSAVIVVSGFASRESAIELMNLGIDAYLEKPFDDIYEVGSLVDQVLVRLARRRRQFGVKKVGSSDEQTDPFRRAVRLLERDGTPARAAELLALLLEEEERELFAQGLRGLEAPVTVAANAEKAQERCRMGTVGLLVVDAEVTGPDVFELLSNLREWSPATPALVVADRPSLSTLIRLINHGAAGLLERPLRGAAVRQEINRVLTETRLSAPPPASRNIAGT